MVVSFFVIILIFRIIDHELKAHYHPLQWSSYVFIILLSLQCFILTISPLHPNLIYDHHIDHQGRRIRGATFLASGWGGAKDKLFRDGQGQKSLGHGGANVRPSRAGAFFGQGKKAVNHNLLVELSIWRGHVFYTQHNLARSKLRFIPRMLENFVKINL